MKRLNLKKQSIKKRIRRIADTDDIYTPNSVEYKTANDRLAEAAKRLAKECDFFQERAKILAKNADDDDARTYYTLWGDKARLLSKDFAARSNAPLKKMYHAGISHRHYRSIMNTPDDMLYKLFGVNIGSEYGKIKSRLKR